MFYKEIRWARKMRPKFAVRAISPEMFRRHMAGMTELKRISADHVSGQRDPHLGIGLRSVDVNKVGLTTLVSATGFCRNGRSAGPVTLAAI